MSVSVIVPFRPDGNYRDRVWGYLKGWWAYHHPDWEVIQGTCPDGPWIKSLAVQDALQWAKGDVLVLADADVVCHGVEEAVERLSECQWAVPHWMVHRLSRKATDDALGRARFDMTDLEEPPYEGVTAGGLTVIRRSLYEEAPFDPRFKGWGQEDWAAGIAWSTLGGEAWNGRSPLYHFWHPPMPRKTRSVGSNENVELYRRYVMAMYDQDGIRKIVAEFKGGA